MLRKKSVWKKLENLLDRASPVIGIASGFSLMILPHELGQYLALRAFGGEGYWFPEFPPTLRVSTSPSRGGLLWSYGGHITSLLSSFPFAFLSKKFGERKRYILQKFFRWVSYAPASALIYEVVDSALRRTLEQDIYKVIYYTNANPLLTYAGNILVGLLTIYSCYRLSKSKHN